MVALGLLLALLGPGIARAQDDPRAFPETGFSIADDAIWTFFSEHGAVNTFGSPISREFLLMGAPVQLFQDAALQVQPDGSVQPMQLTAQALLPYASLAGLTVPLADPAVAVAAPNPDQGNYGARLQVFLQSSVPEVWNGKSVQFSSTFTTAGGAEVWGLPTSRPAADPANPLFVYQRFQNGILLYDAANGTTQALPMGEYVKAVLTGQNLPADLADEAAGSPLLRQYDPAFSQSLARPAVLSQTNLTDAFTPDIDLPPALIGILSIHQ